MKRALLVGIDDYDNFGSLAGCVNDVSAVEPLLARNEDGSPSSNCQRKTTDSERVERDGVLNGIDALLGPGADVALLYFAGHGDVRNNDVTLVMQDGSDASPGIALSEILAKVADSPVGEITIVLDCCFAGAAGTVPQFGAPGASVLRDGVSILAASRPDQPSSETPEGRGAFSVFFCAGLDGGAADVLGQITLAGLYSYLDESFGPWDQRPVFKANVDRLSVIRKARPAVSEDELRRLPELFPDQDGDLPLDPSYEPDAEPDHEEHEAIFAILQRFRAAKLVEPVDAEHMYFAAMENKACRLTALGKHYRHMVELGRL